MVKAAKVAKTEEAVATVVDEVEAVATEDIIGLGPGDQVVAVKIEEVEVDAHGLTSATTARRLAVSTLISTI